MNIGMVKVIDQSFKKRRNYWGKVRFYRKNDDSRSCDAVGL